MNKPPHQMRHWFESAGFKMTYIKRKWREYPMGYSKKLNRHIRVLSHLNIMEICDGDFDRWANSVGGSVTIPKTKQDFDKAIRNLTQETPNAG